MFFQGQDSIKKEFTRQFLGEDFSWIDNKFPDEEDKDEEGKEQTEDNPTDWVSADNVIDVENTKVIETQEKESENDPPM